MMRWALLVLVAPLAAGCGTAKSVKEKLTPKASVMGVSVVDIQPTHMTLKVDIKTDDVDLMLGMVKLKYKFTMLEVGEQGSDGIPPADLLNLSDSGFAFLVKVPFTQAGAEKAKLGYLVQGSIVFKVIAKLADVPFSYQGELAFKK